MPKSLEQVADELGISRVTLWRKLKDMGYSVPRGGVYPETEAKIKQLVRDHAKLKKRKDD